MRYLLVLLMFLLANCTSLKEKCVKIDVGEGGRVSLPSTSYFSSNLGSAEGPVKMESCPASMQKLPPEEINEAPLISPEPTTAGVLP